MAVEANTVELSGFSWLEAVLFPSTSEHLGIFYLTWIGLFLFVHLVWDAKSAETPGFHLRRLESKFSVLFSAATFSSSFIVILSVPFAPVRLLLADTSLPLVLSGFSGLLLSIPALCPYEIRKQFREEVSKDDTAKGGGG
ncbi:hypothetical protein KUV51_20165 [Tateyamaria omphalii]|uniref:hypothetical protein n=1 Tax=Tateyamaria omphalii TaxID=299262 RepID=UPI001C9942FE|nr:hypothetical protein [Tateyamaria omphalii]MBY5935333.1 hypothetical protein [Tateyamaria omphalii]